MVLKLGQRARSDEAKAERRAAVLEAARHMLSNRDPDALTMGELADVAGLAKGTLYLYFPTRESLLLAILIEELRDFFEEVGIKLARAAGSEAAAGVIAGALGARPLLRLLLQSLHVQIEHNVTFEELTVFKTFLWSGLTNCGSALEGAANLPPGAGFKAFLRAHALSIGLSQMATRPPLLDKVFAENPLLAAMAIDFETEFQTALADLLKAERYRD